MTEGGGVGGEHALVMPSWDNTGPLPEKVAAPTPPATGSATAIERFRRLLKQIVADRPRDDWPPLPKP
jgi:hypothetical protein